MGTLGNKARRLAGRMHKERERERERVIEGGNRRERERERKIKRNGGRETPTKDERAAANKRYIESGAEVTGLPDKSEKLPFLFCCLNNFRSCTFICSNKCRKATLFVVRFNCRLHCSDGCK
jgi:hypothetical protein